MKQSTQAHRLSQIRPILKKSKSKDVGFVTDKQFQNILISETKATQRELLKTKSDLYEATYKNAKLKDKVARLNLEADQLKVKVKEVL